MSNRRRDRTTQRTLREPPRRRRVELRQGSLGGGDAKIASITVCQDRAAAEESTAKAAGWVKDRLASLVTSGPDVLMGDTTVSETAGQ